MSVTCGIERKKKILVVDSSWWAAAAAGGLQSEKTCNTIFLVKQLLLVGCCQKKQHYFFSETIEECLGRLRQRQDLKTFLSLATPIYTLYKSYDHSLLFQGSKLILLR